MAEAEHKNIWGNFKAPTDAEVVQVWKQIKERDAPITQAEQPAIAKRERFIELLRANDTFINMIAILSGAEDADHALVTNKQYMLGVINTIEGVATWLMNREFEGTMPQELAELLDAPADQIQPL